ncbi:MAG: M24 family metallopeptidase [Dehalococcoidia bacterium]|nr:M24 family metallopeptidase [Dehalococcoidia bacterium]
MSIQEVIEQAQEYMQGNEVDGWLLYDYRGLNPIFADTVGHVGHVTRPVWLWIPASGDPILLLSFVDQSRFDHMDLDTNLFINRRDMIEKLGEIVGLSSGGAVLESVPGVDSSADLGDAIAELRRELGTRRTPRVAMEYTPEGALPRVSNVDGGTLELVKNLGVEIVPSADLLQYATQRWNEEQLESHLYAAEKLSVIVLEAFRYIGDRIDSGVTEYDVKEFINNRFLEEGMIVTDGPAVAVNEHASDPHFDPMPENSVEIKRGDWVLIDLWTRLPGEDDMFGDITWTAYVGSDVPAKHREVFDIVLGSRDAALAEIQKAFDEGRVLEGWQLDKVARDYIEEAGYGEYFNHRLGHSLGREVHSNAVNLDSWETHDTRQLIPGVAVTIEPGIYIPEFGVRSEIDVFITEDGPQVTTQMQRDVVLIEA